MVRDLESDSVKYGKFLAHPPSGEEICISGMSGRFPLASNIEELKQNLYNKVDMISSVSQILPDMPPRIGKLKDKDLRQFDSGFFGIHRLHAQTMNQMAKLFLECCVEAIFDAGLHPSDLEGTKTGVFTGMCFTENGCHWYPLPVPNGFPITGNMAGMIANRISYFFKLNGYSSNTDTACSSSLFALDEAYHAMKRGDIDNALVCGANLTLSDGITLQFSRLGVLSKEGVLRAFDDDGIGYVRSEAVTALLLQKATHSNRIYAKIIHMKTNCDGYKEQGITCPGAEAQLKLFKEIYFESGVSPHDVSYIEAHGTGTPVGDPVELNGVDAFFAKGRSKPLLIGSVKSNLGHSEPASGMCSVIKSILALEYNLIPPNINFKTPRSGIPGFTEGRLKVVTDSIPFQDKNGIIGVNNFGFGGANAHVILKWNPKDKTNNENTTEVLPKIVCVSGRTEEAVNCLLDDVAQHNNIEHIALIYNSFRKPIKNHLYRGFSIFSTKGVLKQSVKLFNPTKNNLHICFGTFLTNSDSIVQTLLKWPILADLKNRIEQFLPEKNLSLDSISFSKALANQNHILLGVITQLFLAELLDQLNIEYTSVSGRSYGKLVAAYFEKVMSLKQVLNCIFTFCELSEGLGNNKYDPSNNCDESNKYRKELLTKFQQIMQPPHHFNGFNGTSPKTKTAEYFVEALLNNSQSVDSMPAKACIILEVGQGWSANKKRGLSVVSVDGNFEAHDILETMGILYEYGLNPQIQKLYPKVEFPVSRGTPMISSKIKWKHDFEYFVPKFELQKNDLKDAIKFSIHPKNDIYSNLVGHVIDGRNLFPATGYLYLAWCLFGEVQGKDLSQLHVVFENCQFKRACQVPNVDSRASLELCVMLQRASGKFEITEDNVPVVTGQIHLADDMPIVKLNTCIKNVSSNNKLDTKDIYKELRLRGYNYSGVFKSLLQSDITATHGKIRWVNDWVAFMDTMLQFKILSEDSRLLYVPVSIAKLTLNPTAHLKVVGSLKGGDENKVVSVPVEHCADTNTIRSGGIEVSGLLASSIPRKKITALPVLEKYQFIPNKTKLSLKEAVRVFMQVALENNCGLKVKIVELVDQANRNDLEFLGPVIQDVLGDQPLVNADITILSDEENLDVAVKVQNKKLSSTSENTVVVGSSLLSRKEILEVALRATLNTGFLISREELNLDVTSLIPSGLTLLNISQTDKEMLVFLRKNGKSDGKSTVYIKISTQNSTFGWLPKLKSAVNKDCEVVAWCQHEPLNGILGLVNCIRREPGCQNVKCVLIADTAPDFDAANPFYKKQLDKNMGVNVYANGEWGTYRHLLLDVSKKVKIEHCYANSTVRGDLSSIKWIEGPLTTNVSRKMEEPLIEIYYASLNFRDVMAASGRINVDIITRDRREQECVQGFEFSGKTISGKRVMGMVSQGALATLVKAKSNLLWEIPSNWSLMEAATVPVVYSTCLYALVLVGKIKPSDSVLIHSGTGGIGQAAINLCLSIGCTVFTTVGTKEKREFILKQWPQINERNIGNSRDVSFEQMIHKQTNGRGVDIVLNSLAEEKLFASARCLAANGRFLEIGKFDLANNNRLNLLPFKEGASYHGVMLDKLFSEGPRIKEDLRKLVQQNIDLGTIKPLMANVFNKHEVEKAFRFMATGKHMGKVLVNIRNEEESVSKQDLSLEGLPRYYCSPDKSYIICGGLGGFGLELADWLILRGAKHLILTSRKGITTGYQKYRMSIWKSYFCKVKISTQDITTKSGCIELLKEANSLAPVDAIFNLAVVLKDAILENQTEESFVASFGPKAYATEYMDEISRTMCPTLRDFVVFSSVSCGRGNAGQTNYGMSNSIMERICEKRRAEGYPALAIQWGAVGDVGLVAAMQEDNRELEIGGTLQQGILNCLQVLDIILRQNEAVIVSSMVVAERKAGLMSENIEEVVAAILGIKDMKSVSSHSSLAEIGMDSMNAVEVKQVLEREYNLFLSSSELRSITLSRIKELHEKTSTDEKISTQDDDTSANFADMFNFVYEEKQMLFPICKLKSIVSEDNRQLLPKIIAFPGVEGTCVLLQNLTKSLKVEAFGINYIPSIQKETVSETSEAVLPFVQEILNTDRSFHIVAHSVGCNLAMEVTSRLEKLGFSGTLTLLDGSPTLIKKLVVSNTLLAGGFGDDNLENGFIAGSLRFKLNVTECQKIMEDVCKCKSLKEKIKVVIDRFPDKAPNEETLLVPVTAVKKRYSSCLTYTPSFTKLKSKVHLYKPTMVSAVMDRDDYDVGDLCEQPVTIKVFKGSHLSFLEDEELAKTIMEDLPAVNGYFNGINVIE